LPVNITGSLNFRTLFERLCGLTFAANKNKKLKKGYRNLKWNFLGRMIKGAVNIEKIRRAIPKRKNNKVETFITYDPAADQKIYKRFNISINSF
jgi:hypothetical protein